MRKSIVLALAIVMAFAGATWAATPEFSGELKVGAESNSGLTGSFNITSEASLGVKFGEEGDNWSLSLGLAGVNLLGGGTWNLANYKADLKADGFDVTLARNVNIGALGGPFGYVSSERRENRDRIRINTTLGDLKTTAEFDQSIIGLYGSTTVSGMTIGGAAHLNRGTGDNDFAGYVSTSFGMLDVDFEAGSVKGATKWGVQGNTQVTDQLSLTGTYESNNVWSVRGVYVEGLLRATAGYNDKGAADIGVIYRGSEDNQGFADLFKKTHYFRNVAPAFGGSYNTGTSTFTLNATAPLADNFAVLGKVEVNGGGSTFRLDARYAVNDKFTISPYAESGNKFGSDFAYAVGAGATIDGNIESDNGKAKSSFGFTIEF